jgi:gliding motility-associated protein GldC
MTKSTITIEVQMDKGRVPESINWSASDTTVQDKQKARAFLLSLWDGNEKTALRIDLWTKEMMVDEMTDFFYQTIMTMADTYERATKNKELVDDMKNFARDFYAKFREQQLKANS